MADKAWKAVERAAAKFFGTMRNPLSGRNSKHSASDSLHSKLFIETKYRKSFAHHNILSDAGKLADKEEKLPILVTKHHNQHGFNVTVFSEDLLYFCKLFLECKGYKVVQGTRHAKKKALRRKK